MTPTTELINMTASEARAIIREIMTTYDKYLEIWMKKFGSKDGYDVWFSKHTLLT